MFSNESDSSYQTLFSNKNDKSSNLYLDTSLKRNILDISNPNQRDASMANTNLECIEEEKKIDHSYDLKNNANEPVNERYRKSLVFNSDGPGFVDKLNQIELEEIWDDNNNDKYGELSKEFEAKVQQKKNKKERIDFDEMDTKIFDKSATKNLSAINQGKNMMSSNFSKDTAATKGLTSGMNQTFMKQTNPDPLSNQDDIEEEDVFGDDFMSKSKKAKKSNNLLSLLSNDDINNMKDNIINDLRQSQMRSKVVDKIVEESKAKEDDVEDMEEEIFNGKAILTFMDLLMNFFV